MDNLTVHRADAADATRLRDQMLALYTEIYAPHREEAFRSPERFARRLDAWLRAPGFTAAIGYLNDQPVGYAYGSPLSADTRWWKGLRTPVAPELTIENGNRTLALSELMVLTAVRGTGAAKRIHDELLRDRTEERVTLLVDREHPRVRTRYEEWGYRRLGEVQPFPDSPVFDAMILSLPRTS
jgi:hypothetical protein